MSFAELSTIQVRNKRALARRWGNASEAEAFDRELRLRRVETLLRQTYDGEDVPPLDRASYDRLVAALVERRDRAELEREAVSAAADVQRLATALQEHLRAGATTRDALQSAVRVDALAGAAQRSA